MHLPGVPEVCGTTVSPFTPQSGSEVGSTGRVLLWDQTRRSDYALVTSGLAR